MQIPFKLQEKLCRPILEMTSILRAYARSNLSLPGEPAVGDTKTSALAADHSGWLVCDGRLVNVGDYLSLFYVMGYSFGGSGDQFNLPDPRGRVAGFVGSGTGLTSRTLGTSLGEEEHTLTVSEMPSHNHGGNTGYSSTGITLNDPGHSHTGVPNQASTAINGASNNTGNGGSTGTSSTGITVSDPTHRHVIASQGGGLPHNNMQPTLFLGNLFIYGGRVNGTMVSPYSSGVYVVPPNNTMPNGGIIQY
jgi:microcystin-dependent protein